MPKRMTQEEFILKANEIHNHKYDYSLVKYVNNSTKIEIICPIHNYKFKISPDAHTGKRKTGCPVCSCRKITRETFIEKSKSLYPNKFNYDNVEVEKGNRSIVELECIKHKYKFKVMVGNHYKGLGGCRKCRSENLANILSKSQEDYIKQCKEKFPEFNYDKTVYTNAFNLVRIECKKHGEFEIPASRFLNSRKGCPSCATDVGTVYNKKEYEDIANGRECTLYLLECWNDFEKFYKIGITIQGIKKRFESKNGMPYNFKILKELKGTAGDMWEKERYLKTKINKEFKYKPKIKFNGSSQECFNNLEEIKKLL